MGASRRTQAVDAMYCRPAAGLHGGRVAGRIASVIVGRRSFSARLRNIMPRRRSAAPLIYTRLAAILPALVAALLLSLPAARAADFIDAAGRHVALPSRIGRVLPAERNAEV